MTGDLRAELLKQRTTRTNVGLFAAMLGLVLVAVLLHGYGLSVDGLDSRSEQLTLLFGWGEVVAALFAALLGALSITGEFRHGTIRPTFLVTPQRGRVVTAKVWAGMLVGIVFGFIASAIAVGAGTGVLSARGVNIRLDGGDDVRVLVGGAAAAGLWAAIGVGLGAVVAIRYQPSSASSSGCCSSRNRSSQVFPTSAAWRRVPSAGRLSGKIPTRWSRRPSVRSCSRCTQSRQSLRDG